MKVNRKQFLQTVAGASLQAAQQTGRSPSASSRPNVLILMSDQHRHDLMTCAGQDMVPTPHLDRIAANGVRFSNAYCPYPVCVGSRSSFLSGLFAHHHGAITNELSLDWRTRTIAHHFRDNGYVTGLIGKMHLNQPHLHGFDYHEGFNDYLMQLGPKTQLFANDIASHQFHPDFINTVYDHGSGFPELPELWSEGSPWVGHVKLNDKVASDLEPEDHIDAFVARESARFLGRFKDTPFFLIAGFLKPHMPFHPPREWAEKYPMDKMKLPPVGDSSQYPKHIQTRIQGLQSLDERRLRSGRAGYLGNLGFVDVCVGQVYKALEDLGLIDNTIVIYTSDHGDMNGDHGLWGKFVLYEPSVAVPLIISYPKTIPRGKVSRALVEFMGIYPTLAELTGTGMPTGIDARSFATEAKNPSAAGPSALFAEYDLGTAVPQYMIRTPRYKYIHNDGQIDELYDAEADPGEFVNRARETGMKRTRDQLRDQLFAWYNPESNPFRRKPKT